MVKTDNIQQSDIKKSKSKITVVIFLFLAYSVNQLIASARHQGTVQRDAPHPPPPPSTDFFMKSNPVLDTMSV